MGALCKWIEKEHGGRKGGSENSGLTYQILYTRCLVCQIVGGRIADLLSIHNMFTLDCKLFLVYWQDRHSSCIYYDMDTRKGKNYQATSDPRGELYPASAGLCVLTMVKHARLASLTFSSFSIHSVFSSSSIDSSLTF